MNMRKGGFFLDATDITTTPVATIEDFIEELEKKNMKIFTYKKVSKDYFEKNKNDDNRLFFVQNVIKKEEQSGGFLDAEGQNRLRSPFEEGISRRQRIQRENKLYDVIKEAIIYATQNPIADENNDLATPNDLAELVNRYLQEVEEDYTFADFEILRRYIMEVMDEDGGYTESLHGMVREIQQDNLDSSPNLSEDTVKVKEGYRLLTAKEEDKEKYYEIIFKKEKDLDDKDKGLLVILKDKNKKDKSYKGGIGKETIKLVIQLAPNLKPPPFAYNLTEAERLEREWTGEQPLTDLDLPLFETATRGLPSYEPKLPPEYDEGDQVEGEEIVIGEPGGLQMTITERRGGGMKIPRFRNKNLKNVMLMKF